MSLEFSEVIKSLAVSLPKNRVLIALRIPGECRLFHFFIVPISSLESDCGRFQKNVYKAFIFHRVTENLSRVLTNAVVERYKSLEDVIADGNIIIVEIDPSRFEKAKTYEG